MIEKLIGNTPMVKIKYCYQNNENYQDVPGLCKVVTIDEIKENNYVLTPGRYVGVEEEEDDGIPFEDKMKTLTEELAMQIKKSNELDEEIKRVLEDIGYEI